MLPSYSQTSSNSKVKDTMVLVPVSSLRNALIVLEEKKYCLKQLEVARDTIKIQSEKIQNLDTIVINQNSIIDLLKQNNSNYKKVVENKDTEIQYYKDLYKKEKRNKWIAIGSGGTLLLISILFL